MNAGWLGKKFSRRLAAAFCLAAVAVVLVTSFLVARHDRKALLIELTSSLTTTAKVVEAQTDKSLLARRDTAGLSKLSHYLSKASDARITFIAADGAVLGDSSVPADRLAMVENHADRAEVRAALRGDAGANVHLSHTTGEKFLYAAVPSRSDGRLMGVVRAAYPLKQIEAKERRMRDRTIILSIFVVLAAIVLALALASSLSRPVREMSSVAGRLAEGDFEARVVQIGEDEHGQLGNTLNLLAAQVQRTVQELSRDKAQLSAILFNMSEAVVAIDAAGRVVAVNPALTRVFGLDPAGSRGKMVLEVLRHHQLDEVVRGVLSDQKTRTDEIRVFAPDERIFEAQAAPLFEEGKFSGALVVLHDITRLRRLEQVRRDFVANVSHELRTPLASIKGFAETLEMGAISDPKNAPGFVHSIQKQADRMTLLVEDLLDLTAIESGERAPVIEAVSAADVLDDVCAGLRPLAGRKKVDLKFDVPAGLLPVAADRNQFRQIFVNLLENALKFTTAGSVTLAARAAGDRLEISVTDTGIGIPSEDLDRIFERFYRVDKARSREMGGTGLGLSIVKHLVEAHAGSIRVESSIGKGSVFTVSLPVFK